MRLFVYFSEICGHPVIDSDGKVVGKIRDIVMHINEEVFPRAKEIIIEKGSLQKVYAKISVDHFKSLGDVFTLKLARNHVPFQKETFRPDFSLRRHILDQQVVDTNGRKVVRVNDVHLLRVDNQIYLAHVDVGLRGLVRRLDWTPFIDAVVSFVSPKSPYLEQEKLISWKYTHVLAIENRGRVLRSTIEYKKLARIPSAELAEIMSDLDVFERLSFFKTLTVDVQRKVFTDMPPQEKVELVDRLSDLEAGNLLENIPADEATDLLHDLPKDKRIQLLRYMHSKTSKELRKLLGFAQDTAGGLMTTEYLSLKSDATVEDAMRKIKENTDFPGNIYNIYVVDDSHHLIGVTSLRRFMNEDPKKLLTDTCFPMKISVRTDDGMEEIAILLEKYKFLAVPVVDENGVLQGIITTDDVMEELISMTWTKYKDQL